MKAIELQKKISEGLIVKVFDIRLREKYDNCHIIDAINIEKGKLLENPSEYMTKKKKYMLHVMGVIQLH